MDDLGFNEHFFEHYDEQIHKYHYIEESLSSLTPKRLTSIQNYILNHFENETNYIIDLIYHLADKRPFNWKLYASIMEKLPVNPKFDEVNKRFSNYLIKSNVITGIDPDKEYENMSAERIEEEFSPRSIGGMIRNDDIDSLVTASLEGRVDYTIEIEFRGNEISYLDLAAFYGSLSAFNHFLSNGAKISWDTAKKAVMGGNMEIIKKCKENNCDFFDCFMIAINYHQNEVLQWLITNFDAPKLEFFDLVKMFNSEALLYMARIDRIELSAHGVSPLSYVAYSRPDLTILLLQFCSEPNEYDDFGFMPLHNAVIGKNIKCVELLLQCGADVNCVGPKQVNPLYLAKQLKLDDIADLLTDNDAVLPEHLDLSDDPFEFQELIMKREPEKNATHEDSDKSIKFFDIRENSKIRYPKVDKILKFYQPQYPQRTNTEFYSLPYYQHCLKVDKEYDILTESVTFQPEKPEVKEKEEDGYPKLFNDCKQTYPREKFVIVEEDKKISTIEEYYSKSTPCPEITHISIEGRIPDEYIFFKKLVLFPNLQFLRLAHTSLNELDFKHKVGQKLDNLIWLEVSGDYIINFEQIILALNSCPKLQTIDFAGTPLGNDEIFKSKILYKYPNIDFVNGEFVNAQTLSKYLIERVPPTEDKYEAFFRNTILRVPEIRYVSKFCDKFDPKIVTNLSLQNQKLRKVYLSEFTELISLNLAQNCIENLNYVGIECCEELASLDLSDNWVKDVINIYDVSRCPKLTSIIFRGNMVDDYRHDLIDLMSKTVKFIDEVPVSKSEIGQIKQEKEDPQVIYKEIWNKQLSEFENFKAVKTLSLPCQDLYYADVTQLVNLEKLDLRCNKFKKVEGLNKLKRLKYLDLSGNPNLDLDATLEQLKGMPKLQMLNLAHDLKSRSKFDEIHGYCYNTPNSCLCQEFHMKICEKILSTCPKLLFLDRIAINPHWIELFAMPEAPANYQFLLTMFDTVTPYSRLDFNTEKLKKYYSRVKDLCFGRHFTLYKDLTQLSLFTKLQYLNINPEKRARPQDVANYLSLFGKDGNHNLVPNSLLSCKNLRHLVLDRCNCGRDINGTIDLLNSLPFLVILQINPLENDKDLRCWKRVIYECRNKLLDVNDYFRFLDVPLNVNNICDIVTNVENKFRRDERSLHVFFDLPVFVDNQSVELNPPETFDEEENEDDINNAETFGDDNKDEKNSETFGEEDKDEKNAETFGDDKENDSIDDKNADTFGDDSDKDELNAETFGDEEEKDEKYSETYSEEEDENEKNADTFGDDSKSNEKNVDTFGDDDKNAETFGEEIMDEAFGHEDDKIEKPKDVDLVAFDMDSFVGDIDAKPEVQKNQAPLVPPRMQHRESYMSEQYYFGGEEEVVEVPEYLDIKFALTPEEVHNPAIIKDLDLSDCNISSINLSDFNHKDLREFIIRLNLENNSLITPFSNDECQAGESHQDGVKYWNLPNLEVLNIRQNLIESPEHALEFIVPCPKLKHVLLEEQKENIGPIEQFRIKIITGIIQSQKDKFIECVKQSNEFDIDKFLELFSLRAMDNKWIMPSEFFRAFNKIPFLRNTRYNKMVFKMKLAYSRNESDETTLDLSSAELNFDEVFFLEEIVPMDERVRFLNLSNNDIDEEQLENIKGDYFPLIEHLDLSNNKIEVGQDFSEINEFLSEFPKLRTLNIFENPVTNGTSFKEFMYSYKMLLDPTFQLELLNDTKMTPELRRDIVDKASTTMSPESFLAFYNLNKIHMDWRTLTRINLSGCNLAVLDPLIECVSVVELNLSNNVIEYLPVDIFKNMKDLQVLNISNNMIGNPTGKQVEAVTEPLGYCVSLISLTMRGCFADKEYDFMKYFTKVCKRMRLLSTLDDASNNYQLTGPQMSKLSALGELTGWNYPNHSDDINLSFVDYGGLEWSVEVAEAISVIKPRYMTIPGRFYRELQPLVLAKCDAIKRINGDQVDFKHRLQARKEYNQKLASENLAGFLLDTIDEIEDKVEGIKSKITSIKENATKYGTLISKWEIFITFQQMLQAIIVYIKASKWPAIYKKLSWIYLFFTVNLAIITNFIKKIFTVPVPASLSYWQFFIYTVVPVVAVLFYRHDLKKELFYKYCCKRYKRTFKELGCFLGMLLICSWGLCVIFNLNEIIYYRKLVSNFWYYVFWLTLGSLCIFAALCVGLWYFKKRADNDQGDLWWDEFRIKKASFCLFILTIMYAPAIEFFTAIIRCNEEGDTSLSAAFDSVICFDLRYPAATFNFAHLFAILFIISYSIWIPVVFVLEIIDGISYIQKSRGIKDKEEEIKRLEEQLKLLKKYDVQEVNKAIFDGRLDIALMNEDVSKGRKKYDVTRAQEYFALQTAKFDAEYAYEAQNYEHPASYLYSQYKLKNKYAKVLDMIQKVGMTLFTAFWKSAWWGKAMVHIITHAFTLLNTITRPFLCFYENVLKSVSQGSNSGTIVTGEVLQSEKWEDFVSNPVITHALAPGLLILLVVIVFVLFIYFAVKYHWKVCCCGCCCCSKDDEIPQVDPMPASQAISITQVPYNQPVEIDFEYCNGIILEYDNENYIDNQSEETLDSLDNVANQKQNNKSDEHLNSIENVPDNNENQSNTDNKSGKDENRNQNNTDNKSDEDENQNNNDNKSEGNENQSINDIKSDENEHQKKNQNYLDNTSDEPGLDSLVNGSDQSEDDFL